MWAALVQAGVVGQVDLSTTAAHGMAEATRLSETAATALPMAAAPFGGFQSGASLGLVAGDTASPAEAAWNGVMLGLPADPSPSPTTKAPWSQGDWEAPHVDLGTGPKPPTAALAAAATQAAVVDVPAGTVVSTGPAAEAAPEIQTLKALGGLDIDMKADPALSTTAMILAVLVVAVSGSLLYLVRQRRQSQRRRWR